MPLNLVAELQFLVAAARADGSDQSRVDLAGIEIFNALMDLQDTIDGNLDPRRQRTLQLARRIQRAHASGATIPQLMERFNASRPKIYRLLCLMTSRDKYVRK
jgi:hypothetical protein